ncbi:MAG TPA: leucine-rich repeat domain-containing protein [Verrucomicrobiae bacterium]|nr:leucine-rich repeat domain-containing protein [Verrucomicrobiae bacterium]
MKTRVRGLFFRHVLVACICFCLNRAETARAQSGNYNGFYWQKSGNGASITGYSGSGGAVTIPGLIPYSTSNLTVTSIGNGAFEASQVTSVTVPNSVASVGNGAFAGCFYLASINIPNGVTSIGNSAFLECLVLTNVTIPNTVTAIGQEAFESCPGPTNVPVGSGLTSIGLDAFYGCRDLLAFTVDPADSFYSSWGGVLFNKNTNTLIQFPCGVGGSYVIPNSVTNIGTNAFADCVNLHSVAIPNSVTNIGGYAFINCYGLTNITIPDRVTSIGDYTFFECFSLTSVTFGSAVTRIGENAFGNCVDLNSIYFRGNAPSADSTVFASDTGGETNVIAYFLPGNLSWGVFSMNTRIPVAWWTPQIQTGGSRFGVKTNQFSFNINWTSGQTVTIEACTNLFNPDWQLLQTNTLTADSFYFNDPQATNYPRRYYRIMSP